VHVRDPGGGDGSDRALERCVVLIREADDHVRGEVEIGEPLEAPEIGRRGVAPPHRTEHAVVARLERDVKVARECRRLAERGLERVVDVIDLDRRKPEAREPRYLPHLTHETCQCVPSLAVPVATEVDAGQHDFAMPLFDPPAHLGQDRSGAAAPAPAAHQRNDAEVAREAAAILDLDERAHTIEPRVVVDAADRADVARDEVRGVLAPATYDGDVVGEPDERVANQVRRAARHVHALVCARGPSSLLARLRHGFVRDAASVDDGDVRVALTLCVAVRDEPLPELLRVGVRDLAPEEANGERRHARDRTRAPRYVSRKRSAAQPSRTRRSTCSPRSICGRSRSR
jgi:hypothetical protein